MLKVMSIYLSKTQNKSFELTLDYFLAALLLCSLLSMAAQFKR